MNQFKQYERQLKKCSRVWEVANDFDYILNNIWCTYSFEKGRDRWKEIRSNIPDPYKFRIDIEIDHVWLGHGISQARLAVKHRMEEYLIYLLK